MTEDHPFQSNILEMLGTDLSSVCTEVVVRGILGRNLYIWMVKSFLDGGDVEGDGGNDNV